MGNKFPVHNTNDGRKEKERRRRKEKKKGKGSRNPGPSAFWAELVLGRLGFEPSWFWADLVWVELVLGRVDSIDIEYNKRLDRQRPCLEGDFNGGSNNIVQSNKSV